MYWFHNKVKIERVNIYWIYLYELMFVNEYLVFKALMNKVFFTTLYLSSYTSVDVTDWYWSKIRFFMQHVSPSFIFVTNIVTMPQVRSCLLNVNSKSNRAKVSETTNNQPPTHQPAIHPAQSLLCKEMMTQNDFRIMLLLIDDTSMLI